MFVSVELQIKGKKAGRRCPTFKGKTHPITLKTVIGTICYISGSFLLFCFVFFLILAHNWPKINSTQ